MMPIASRQLIKRHGFSLLELLVVIIIISTLLGIAIERLLKLQVQAERSSMEGVLGTMQSAIALTIGEHIVKGKTAELTRYLNRNPMELLTEPPSNYLGSFHGRPSTLEHASWWYDLDAHSLNYYAQNHEYLHNESDNKRVIRFKIFPVYDDKDGDGKFDSGDTLVGLRLSPIRKYRWLKTPA